MIKKILVANRGEIAMRIFRTCRVMNISTVAVYTHVDRGALHVRYAEEAYCISESPEETSYLKPELILSIAKKTGAAIHPGYGFLYAPKRKWRRLSVCLNLKPGLRLVMTLSISKNI